MPPRRVPRQGLCLPASLLYTLILWLHLLFTAQTLAHPWLPEPQEWDYSLEVKKNSLSAITRKEMETYQEAEKAIALLENNLYRIRNNPHLTTQQKTNRENEILGNMHNIKQLQEQLITSTMISEAVHFIEHGVTEQWSYGAKYRRTKTNIQNRLTKNSEDFGIFAKRKLLERKNYIFTAQPILGVNDQVKYAGFGLQLGHSNILKKRLVGKQIEIFEYMGVNIQQDIGMNKRPKAIWDSELAMGLKFDNRIVLLVQDFETLNNNAPAKHRRIRSTKFTMAFDINFSPSEQRNKIYLNCGYFVVNSVKARRRLASGYNVGIWAKL